MAEVEIYVEEEGSNEICLTCSDCDHCVTVRGYSDERESVIQGLLQIQKQCPDRQNRRSDVYRAVTDLAETDGLTTDDAED